MIDRSHNSCGARAVDWCTWSGGQERGLRAASTLAPAAAAAARARGARIMWDKHLGALPRTILMSVMIGPRRLPDCTLSRARTFLSSLRR
jgi:hypothetical protein